MLRYEDGGGCALNARLPEGWGPPEPRFGLRFQLRSLTIPLGVPGGSAVKVPDGHEAPALEIRRVAVGPPPPKIRGWRGSASESAIEAQLQAWEEEFPPSSRTAPP